MFLIMFDCKFDCWPFNYITKAKYTRLVLLNLNLPCESEEINSALTCLTSS